jgi:hypothetical protein
MKKKFTKLECAIDGSYVNSNDNTETIENLINPNVDAGKLTFNDKNNSEISLNDFNNKVDLIREYGDIIEMTDIDIIREYGKERSILLDEILSLTRFKSMKTTPGNIVQIANKKEIGKKSLKMNTVGLTEKNHVWINAKAMVSITNNYGLKGEDIKMILRDISTDTILDESVISVPDEATFPVYCSFAGSLGLACTTSEEDLCDHVVYNSFLKRFFQAETGVLNGVHLLSMTLDTTYAIMNYAIMNIIVMDDIYNIDFKSDFLVLRDDEEIDVVFGEEMIDADYSIQLTPERMIRCWWVTKGTGGFTIKTERPYTGKIYWQAIRKRKEYICYGEEE